MYQIIEPTHEPETLFETKRCTPQIGMHKIKLLIQCITQINGVSGNAINGVILHDYHLMHACLFVHQFRKADQVDLALREA